MAENAVVASAATLKNGISLDRLVLIGVFGTEAERRALVRHASGRIERVRPGERLGGARVLAIGTAELVLKSGSGTRTLEMPSG